MAVAAALFAVVLPAKGSADEGEIRVVVPAKKPSRPAHFFWKFKSANGAAPRIGKFACGSYWVAPAEGDKGVILESLKGTPEEEGWLTCDADPITERHGLLNGKNNYGSHDPSENIIPRLPMTFEPEPDSCVSLVAAMQRDESATSKGGTKLIVGEVVDAYCIVTVLPTVPKNGGRDMIRPNITGVRKEFLTWDDFDLSRLPTYPFINGKSAEEWAETALRWRHSSEVFGMGTEGEGKNGKVIRIFSEGGRAFRSEIFFPSGYGATVAAAFNDDVLSLFSAANSLEQKKEALAAMLAYGLDIYHARYNYGDNAPKVWTSGAGQHVGQFLPPVFAAALLRDPEKADRLRMTAITNHAPDPKEQGPQELRQIRRGVTGVLLWGDGHPFSVQQDGFRVPFRRYWSDFTASKCYDGYEGTDKPNANKGKKTIADPYGYIDGPANKPGTSYMGVAMGPMRSFAAVMILMPAVRSVVNTDAPIEYVDRVERHGVWAWPDPVAIPAKEDQDGLDLWRSLKGAKEWGVTWGARPDDPRFAIENGKGRFRSLHGKPIATVYESPRAKRNWSHIITLYDGLKYEDNAVELGVVVAPEIFFSDGDAPAAYLTCATPDAVIHYTLDGSLPTRNSPVYKDQPIPVREGMEVKAFARLDGKKDSKIRSKVYQRFHK